MALTITRVDRNNAGKWVHSIVTVAFDNLYATGGYNVTPQSVGLGAIYGIVAYQINGIASNLARLQWDYKNGKMLCLRSGGQSALVIEESVTVTSNVGTLAQVPAWIGSINASAGSVTGAFNVIPVGTTPITTQCAVNFATGQLTFLGSDAVTTALVTYVPMGVGPFVAANQVIDEAVTLSSSGVNLANQASLIQYIYDTTTPALHNIVGGTLAAASGQEKVALRNSTNTTLTSNAGQSGDSAKVTYWKASAFGLAQGFTAEAEPAVTTSWTSAFPSIVLPTYGTQMVGVASASFVKESLLGPSGTVAANTAVWNPMKNTFSFNAGDSLDHIYVAYVLLDPTIDATFAAEVAPNVTLSPMTAQVTFYGPK